MQNWDAATDRGIVWEIGTRLRRLRLRQNRSQQWLATQTGLSRNTISRIENGAAAVSLLSFVQILRALRSLSLFSALPESDEFSPLQLAKLQRKERRIASKTTPEPETPPSEW